MLATYFCTVPAAFLEAVRPAPPSSAGPISVSPAVGHRGAFCQFQSEILCEFVKNLVRCKFQIY